jgi:carbon monoxide dehydrogenase subunit G
VTVQLDSEFSIPVPVAEAWPVLLDVERIAPCMPGATVTKVDGPNIEGVVKVKVGPITVSYSGTATFLETDETGRRVVIEARGKETRGSGTASARVTTQLVEEGSRTRVTVSTDLSVTGKPAQFGRGVMADVSNKLLGQFAECLSRKLAAGGAPAGDAPAGPAGAGSAGAAGSSSPGQPDGAPASARQPGAVAATVLDGPPAPRSPAPAPARETDEAIDLLGTAGLPILKRFAPLLGAGLLLALLLRALRRRG